MTIALLYYAKPAMLLHQLETFAKYSNDIKEQLTVLIIDDGSPVGLHANEYIQSEIYKNNNDDKKDNKKFPRIRIARIVTEKEWNIGGARNLAFYLADTSRVLLLDLDILIPEPSMREALSWETNNSTHAFVHRFNRILLDVDDNGNNKNKKRNTRIHPAVSVMDVDAYWQNGGCDEDFCGTYGYTDVHFWFRWDQDPYKIQQRHMRTYTTEFRDPPCSPLYVKSMNMQRKCEDAIKVLAEPTRDVTVNEQKMKRRKISNCWSNRYLRFQWQWEIF